MLKIFLNLFIVFLLFCCSSKIEKDITTNSFADKKFAVQKLDTLKLFVTSDNNNPTFNQFLKQNNIKKVGFVGDHQFLDPYSQFTLSPAMMNQELQRAYPSKNETGIAYIDLEAPYLEYLMNSDINSAEFKKSKKLFLDVLAYVKNARPNVQWGFYYVPFTTYWNRTNSFYDKDERITEIINNSDVLFPSIYIFYNKLNFKLENKSYITENTEQIIRIGQKYNKKVYPLIMSRFHPSNSSIGYETIEEDDFQLYFSTIKNTKYNGKSVDGILFWNADKYFYKTNENKVVEEVQKSRTTFDNYYDNYLINILSIMLEKK